MKFSRYQNIGYINDGVRVLVPGAIEVNKILQGNAKGTKENCKISDKIFQLGWSSLAVLEERNGKFRFSGLYRLNRSDRIALPAPEGEFETVVTRGVFTCTYVHIKSGAFHLVAHLDAHDLTSGTALIRSLVEKIPNLILEISRLSFEAEEEKNFATSLRSLPNLSRVKEFYRGNVDTQAFYSHIEIGVDAETGKTYGDTVDLPSLLAGQGEFPLFSDFDALTLDPKTDVSAI